MPDNEFVWIDRAQKGDMEAFSYLVETYQKPVYNMCYRMLGEAGEAEDAAQETFLRAFKSIHRYDNKRPFPTWLLSIAAHYCIDQIRKRRMTIVSMDEHPDMDLPDLAPGPESSLGKREEQQRVRALLEGLSPTDRAAVTMYYWYDFSYEEIAQTLSLSLSAVKSRLHRARQEMAKLWIERQGRSSSAERTYHDHVKSPAF